MLERDSNLLTVAELGRRIRSGELSPVSLTRDLLERIGALDDTLGAFRLVCADRALDEARVADTPPRPQSDPRPRPPVYEPVRVHQESVPGGGTRAEFAPVEAPHVKVYAPDDRIADKDGMIARPNVDYVGEIVNLNQAEHAYKANLKVIATENAMIGALLNEQH